MSKWKECSKKFLLTDSSELPVSKDRYLRDSVDAALEERERLAPGEVGARGRVKGGHCARGCAFEKDGFWLCMLPSYVDMTGFCCSGSRLLIQRNDWLL